MKSNSSPMSNVQCLTSAPPSGLGALDLGLSTNCAFMNAQLVESPKSKAPSPEGGADVRHWTLDIGLELLFIFLRNRRYLHTPARQASDAEPDRLGSDRKLERARRTFARRLKSNRACV